MMLQSVAAVAVGKAKLLGLVAAAVLAGGAAGGYVAAADGSGATLLRVTPSSAHASPKAEHPGNGAQGVHGACVSAVARDHSAVGGPHHNHGGAVSAAAHSCAHGHGAGASAKTHGKHADD
jgi:hypothetical protein